MVDDRSRTKAEPCTRTAGNCSKPVYRMMVSETLTSESSSASIPHSANAVASASCDAPLVCKRQCEDRGVMACDDDDDDGSGSVLRDGDDE
eukprot:2586870-Rhodomonas_salina.1